MTDSPEMAALRALAAEFERLAIAARVNAADAPHDTSAGFYSGQHGAYMDCSDKLRALVDAAPQAQSRVAELEKALRHILSAAGGECERLTSGIGSCWKYWKPDAEYYNDRVCNACIAHAALRAQEKA